MNKEEQAPAIDSCAAASPSSTATFSDEPLRKRQRRGEVVGESDPWNKIGSMVPFLSHYSNSCDQKLAEQPESSRSDGKCHIDGLPDEILEKIFSCLPERDLRRAAGTCQRFLRFANDVKIWKRLFQQVFQYRRPLVHSGQAEFEFCDPQQRPEENPWKESFKQLRHGVHVRPGYLKFYEGQNLTHFDSLERAITFLESQKEEEKLIFLHAGHHDGGITIKTNLQIVAAAPGPNIAEQVIIEQSTDTTVRITEGAHNAYLGYLTVKFAPAESPIDYALKVFDKCSPVLDHCTIHSSSSYRSALCVRGPGACPKVQHCTICNCGDVGILITDHAEGLFENCIIYSTRNWGIAVTCSANPTVIRCDIHHCQEGMLMDRNGRGKFLENKIHHNNLFGIGISFPTDPTAVIIIRKNEIFSNHEIGMRISGEGRALIECNNIHDNSNFGICWHSGADLIVRDNKIHDNVVGGICVRDKGKGHVENNKLYENSEVGILVESGSSPFIHGNSIHSSRNGVSFNSNGHGILEANKIFNHVENGVAISAGSNPWIFGNKIWGCQVKGVHVYNGGRGVLEDNEIVEIDMLKGRPSANAEARGSTI